MVLPLEERHKGPKTLEERLADKFDYLQVAREEKSIDGSDIAFDEIAKSIEILMKAMPEAYQYLMDQKKVLDDNFIEERDDIVREANAARDGISREVIFGRRMEVAKWDYREIYEEILMDVMQAFQLVDMKRPSSVSIIPSSRPEEPEPQAQKEAVQQQLDLQQIPVQQEKKQKFFERLHQEKQKR